MLDFFTNQIVLTCLSTWLAAHFIKFIVAILKGEKNKLKIAFSSGGFPSSHTAIVVCLFMMVGLKTNWSEIETSIVGIFAVIVIYDAVNLRYQAGLHAKALNHLDEVKKFLTSPLKISLGHTYTEMLGGLALGVIVAVASYNCF